MSFVKATEAPIIAPPEASTTVPLIWPVTLWPLSAGSRADTQREIVRIARNRIDRLQPGKVKFPVWSKEGNPLEKGRLDRVRRYPVRNGDVASPSPSFP